MVQIQSSKSWVLKSRFSFKVRQQQLNFQWRNLSFSSTLVKLQPPLQYSPNPFLYCNYFSFTISPNHLFNHPFNPYQCSLHLISLLVYVVTLQSYQKLFSLQQSFSQFKLQQRPNEWETIVRNDTVLIFSCFPEA